MDDAPLTTAEENETELVEEEQQEEESQVISISQLSKGNQLKRREREKESFFYTRERIKEYGYGKYANDILAKNFHRRPMTPEKHANEHSR